MDTFERRVPQFTAVLGVVVHGGIVRRRCGPVAERAGGYSAALRAAQLGKRVGLVERDERIGGTCLLRGCIPAKALLQSAAVMDTVERAAEWGIKASGEPDWTAVKAFEDKIVKRGDHECG